MIFTQMCKTMSGRRLCLIVFLCLSFVNATGAVECFWCSGVGKDRQCELSPRNVSTGPVSTKCSMRYCISTKVMDGVTGEVQSFARHCDHIPHGNVCVKDSRLITCFETCTSDLCNSGNPDPSYLRTQEYSFTYLGLPGLGSALYRSEDKDLLYNDVLDVKSETKQYKDFVTKSSKVSNLERLKIVAYKNKGDGDEGNGQRENKITRPWKWWEMTRGIRRRKGYTATVTRDKAQQVKRDKTKQSLGDHGVTRPASKIVAKSVKAVPSSVKAPENKDKSTEYDNRDSAEKSQLNNNGDEHNKGDNKKFSQRRLEGNSRHTFDYIGYHPLSKKKQSKLDSNKKPKNISDELEKMSNTVPRSLVAHKHRQEVRNTDIHSDQINFELEVSDKKLSKIRSSEGTNTDESIDSRTKIQQIELEQGNIQSAQGNIQSAQGNIQSAQDVERISHNNGKNVVDQLWYVHGISGSNQDNKRDLLKDEQLKQDLTTLRSLSPEYADLTEDELELLPLFEALISDEQLAKHFQTLLIDDETVKETLKETDSRFENKFPTVIPTYGLLETAHIYSSQKDFIGALETRSPQQELKEEFFDEDHVVHHGVVTKFRKLDKPFENDVIPQPFRIRSLELKDKIQNTKDMQNFSTTNLSTTAPSVHVSSTLSRNLAHIDQTKQDSSLPPFFLKLDNGEGSIYQTKNETLNPYRINVVTNKVTSPGTDTGKPKRAFQEMDRLRSPSDSGSSVSLSHNNLKTRPPYWVNEAHGKRVIIHTGKTKEPQMPLEINALKFAKPALRTTVINSRDAVETPQTPWRKNVFSSFGKMNGNNKNDEIMHPYSGHQSSEQRRDLVKKLKDEKLYHVNNELTQMSTSDITSGKEKFEQRNSYKLDSQGHDDLENSKTLLNKPRLPSDHRSGAAITETSLTSDHRSGTAITETSLTSDHRSGTAIRETSLTSDHRSGAAITETNLAPQPITFDTTLTKLYLNNNDFLTSINLRLGKPKSDSKSLPSKQADKENFVTPRSDTYKTTLFTGQVDSVDNDNYTVEGRYDIAVKFYSTISGTTVKTLNDTPSWSLGDALSRSLSDTVSRSHSDTVSRSPNEEVQIATPNPFFSVTYSKNVKTEIPTKHSAIDKSVHLTREDVLSHTSSRYHTVKNDNRFGNKLKEEGKHYSDSVQFGTSGIDKDHTFKASVFVTSATRATPEVTTFHTENYEKTKVSHVVPAVHSRKDKSRKVKKIGLSEMVQPAQRQTLAQETWRTTNALPSNTFKTLFKPLGSNPDELFQSEPSSSIEKGRDLFYNTTEVRNGSVTPYTPLKDDTPSINNENRFVVEAYKDTLRELSQNSGSGQKHALKSPLSHTTNRAPTPTVFVTPRVHRMGRLEKLEGERRMFSFNRENVSSGVHKETTRLCVFIIILMVFIALI